MSDDAYMIVVIDDERTLPISEIPVMLARTSDEGLALLKEFQSSGVRVNELWLDHDLGESDSAPYGWDTIMPVVYWLEEQGHNGTPLDVEFVMVHTANPAAAPAMMEALRPYYRVIRTEFPR
jgi:hypothetical protein